MNENHKRILRSVLLLAIVLFIISIATNMNKDKDKAKNTIAVPTYTQFLADVKDGKIKETVIIEKARGLKEIKVTTKADQAYTILTPADPALVEELKKSASVVKADKEEEGSMLLSILVSWTPMFLFIAIWIYFMKKSMGGKGGIFGFNKSKTRIISPDQISVGFADVVGCDEAKEEVRELVDFLKEPGKFSKLGGSIPKGILLTGPAGTGKAQPLYANIRIPNGWTTMGEIKVGDLVCNPDGGYSKVKALYPQGFKKNYEITFSDGTTAQSCDEHLWTVRFTDLHKEYRNYTLNEIQKKMDKGYKPRLYPISRVDSPEIELPMDAYLMGVLLGDGAIATSHNMISISSGDEAIINSVKELIGEDYQLSQRNKYDHTIIMKNKVSKYLCKLGIFQNKFTQILWDMGLCGKQSHEKFVPQVFFHSSYEQRLSLLQGLMDTDGTIDKYNSTTFCTTSNELANDVVELARSLGMISYISSEKLKNYSYKGAKHIANHKAYNVLIQSFDPSILFRLERKKAIANDRQSIPTKAIEKIEFLGETQMQCIMLDSENHLYITDGYNTTHNTMLAKAIAKEAGVPFFANSGSDFVEMFVGMGAARVRDMFAEARKVAPCILFIDEIDALGGKRGGGGMGGGHDEREQTLNQLLVEMDGVETTNGVVIIGATNRADTLDTALLRPGRLDRHVVVGLPDIKGREHILRVHVNKKAVPIDTNLDLHRIAKGTVGFSGAELENLVNEAAIMAARKAKTFVDQSDFEMAKDKIIMGPERKSMIMPEKERINTAYHESGHAVVAQMLEGTDPVHKVTIIPRGRALGVTMQLPEEDRYAHDKGYLLGRIAVLMGGRLGEELFLKHMTTGASNDIQVATNLARKMVTEWGMSEKLGMISFGDQMGGAWAGQTSMGNLSQETIREVDQEVKRIIHEQYEIAKKILEDNRSKVEAMSKALLEVETLEDWQLENIMKDRDFNSTVGIEEIKAKEPLEAGLPTITIFPPLDGGVVVGKEGQQ